ncbi:MAG: energy transducer TonB [Vicinamibacterales bacterium]
MAEHQPPDVFSAREIAAAAGVSEAEVRARMARGQIRSVSALLPAGAPAAPVMDELVPHAEAARAVRALRHGDPMPPDGTGLPRLLPAVGPSRRGRRGLPLVMASSAHGLLALQVLLVGSLGLAKADDTAEPVTKREPVRLVFLATPGPGGGGGGGGLRAPAPPARAQRKGPSLTSSPVVARRVPPRRPDPPAPRRPLEPPHRPPPRAPEPPPRPVEARTLPTVAAPVAVVAGDEADDTGVIEAAPIADAPPSQGPGTGGGAGAGEGAGIGDGQGPGIGPGSGGGTGGGPYRPGSGVEPPRLLREVRADYSDEAQRRRITGDVVLEIVVRYDGTVGDVRVLQRLGAGLDERAVDAVRRWRFAPATMHGTPVDVLVEVAVEFRLR